MTRYRAAGIHLAISAVIGAAALALLYFVWYPEPYFVASGGARLTLILVSVDVIIGPLLTLVVYQKGKKSLVFDLSVIALLQVGALVYGLSVMAQARPVYLVARVDRFILVAANEISKDDLARAARPEFARLSWSGPRLVGASKPSDPDQQFDAISSGLAGRDLQHRPEFFRAYAEVALDLLERAKPLAQLAERNAANRALIDAWLHSRGHTADTLVYLPLDVRTAAMTMVLDGQDARPLGVLPIDPW